MCASHTPLKLVCEMKFHGEFSDLLGVLDVDHTFLTLGEPHLSPTVGSTYMCIPDYMRTGMCPERRIVDMLRRAIADEK